MNEKKYKTPEAFRTAIETRAKKLRDETGRSLDMQRRKVAFDAFLYRVAVSGAPFVLKGGYLLHLRYNVGVRPTKDLDAAWHEPGLEKLNSKEIESHMREALQAVALIAVDDFFSFEIGESMADLGQGREFTGYRFSVVSRIGSRVFDSFHIDCTTGDALIDPFDVVTVGSGLSFAGIPTAKINAIRAGQHFAEKLHAFCRPRSRQNSRVKDLFDMVLFAKQGVKPSEVARALPKVFETGGNLPIPKTLPEPSSDWRVPYDEMAKDNQLEHTFDEACRIISKFYDDVISI